MRTRLLLTVLLSNLLTHASAEVEVKSWPQLVFRDRIKTEWSEDGKSLWYRTRVSKDQWEEVRVDLATGIRESGDPRPRKQVTALKATMPKPGSGPEVTVTFENTSRQALRLLWRPNESDSRDYGLVEPGRSRDQHTYAGHVWEIQTEAGELLGFVRAEQNTEVIRLDGEPVKAVEEEKPKKRGWTSPDGRHRAFLRDHNVWVSSGSQAPQPWTKEGTADFPFRGPVHWSPDGQQALVVQERPAQKHPVHLIESSPDEAGQPRLHTLDYLKPGDQIARPELRVLTQGESGVVEVDAERTPNVWRFSGVHWSSDSRECFVLYNERGHQRLQVLAIHPKTGAVRTVVDERSETFIDYSQKTELHWLDSTRELIWASERDGWNHLYLYDVREGRVKRQLTKGDWVVREVVHVDEGQRVVWLMAGGIHPDQDPYHLHLVRVALDSGERIVLTEEDGTHEIEFSPDRRHFVDRWSRIDSPPVHQLRRAVDGHLVADLEVADTTALSAAGWVAPERLVAKGRDGSTDIHGFVIRPTSFDAAKAYPVVENIYAGPHGQHVPKAFSVPTTNYQLAEEGFVVVRIDGMGTNWRSKAFHDVCWKNLKDAGFPDRIAWIRAAAKNRPWMDLSRVGIYGGSAGGQNAMGALLHHGDFYHVAVADCGCHDNRMDKIWWNEAWMGWPIGPEYADSSNVTHAAKLRGDLLLIVGELDRNVDPASTMQAVDALVKADKDFDLLVIPGAGHGAAETPYGKRRRRDFLVEHLLGGGGPH